MAVKRPIKKPQLPAIIEPKKTHITTVNESMIRNHCRELTEEGFPLCKTGSLPESITESFNPEGRANKNPSIINPIYGIKAKRIHNVETPVSLRRLIQREAKGIIDKNIKGMLITYKEW